jgi:branched-chain amino acid transport system permease protein
MISLFGSRTDTKQASAVVAILAVAPLVLVETGATYQARLLVLILVFSIIAMALNIVFAHTDQLFLFVGALTGISAYGTILLADSFGLSPWLTLPVGILLAGGAGLLVSYIAARLKMSIIVIAILTLSLQLAVQEFFQGARDITGGTTGFAFRGMGVPVLETLGLTSQLANYYVLLVVLAGSFVLYSRLIRSKYGLAFDAIRQDEVAAESVGINVVRYKLVAGFTGAALIGLVGPLYANAEGWVTPSLFAFAQVDVFVLIILVLGGLRTMLGPVVGAVAIIYLNEQLREFGQWRTALYGLLLMFLFLYFQQGIVSKVEAVYDHRRVREVRNEVRERLG